MPAMAPRAHMAGRIPFWLKVAYTLFVCVLVPIYWREYGPANFLWFSDIALLVTLAAMWLESRFLASMQAVAVTLLELVWLIDFAAKVIAGLHITGISAYMFKPEIPLLVRGLSLFHVWLPFLLLWLVWRLGYDRWAWVAQTILSVLVLLVCYFWTAPADNINWVLGPGEQPQSWAPPELYLALLMAFFPLGIYLPTHWVLGRIFAGSAHFSGQSTS
jgi:hypothetical protein